jgi:hypothetical protein
MSWDIFAQDLPADANSIEDIPENFKPKPIGARADVIARILQVSPEVKFEPDFAHAHLEGDGFSLEISILDHDPCEGVTFRVWGGGQTVINLIADILDNLKLRALQAGDGPHFFDRKTAIIGLESARRYSAQISNK